MLKERLACVGKQLKCTVSLVDVLFRWPMQPYSFFVMLQNISQDLQNYDHVEKKIYSVKESNLPQSRIKFKKRFWETVQKVKGKLIYISAIFLSLTHLPSPSYLPSSLFISLSLSLALSLTHSPTHSSLDLSLSLPTSLILPQRQTETSCNCVSTQGMLTSFDDAINSF